MKVRRVALALVVVAAVAACGLPNDRAPRQIAADKVPFSLLAPSSTLTTASDATGGPLVDLYYFDGDRLRAVRAAVTSASPFDVLSSLVVGLPEGAAGVATAIPKDTRVLSADFDADGVLVVTLSNEIVSTITDPTQGNAFGQLVWTATHLDGVRSVRFRTVDENGQQQDVKPTTDTGQRGDPLDSTDFRSIAPVSQ